MQLCRGGVSERLQAVKCKHFGETRFLPHMSTDGSNIDINRNDNVNEAKAFDKV